MFIVDSYSIVDNNVQESYSGDDDVEEPLNYSVYFVNRVFYDTVHDRCVAAKDIALGLGFQLTRGSHKKNPREEEKRLYLYCSHGGKGPSQSTTTSESSRTTTTSFTSCTFMVCVRSTFVDVEWKWRIDTVKDDVKCGIFRSLHNHQFELWREGTHQWNQLTDEMKYHIRQLEENHVIDKERGLAVALEDVFPSSAHLLCVWHMKRNIEGRVTRLYDRDVAEKFVRGA